MPTYVMLISYTDAGIQHFKHIGDRIAHARQGAAELAFTEQETIQLAGELPV
jgi:uncharacterized protein with GYD domain